MTTQDVADWDEKTEARKMLREWIRMPHQKNDADCIEFFGHHLSLARSTAPSAEAMREAAAKACEEMLPLRHNSADSGTIIDAIRRLPLPPAPALAEAGARNRTRLDAPALRKLIDDLGGDGPAAAYIDQRIALAAHGWDIVDAAVLAAAGAMREAAAQECFDRQADRHGDHEDAWNEACLHCCERVRALPLPPAQPSAPSAEAMREAAVKSIRDDKFQWRSHEHGVTVGLALTDAAVRVSLLPLTLTQPSAVGDATRAMESVTAEALPLDAALSSIPEAEIEVHPYTTTGYQPAAGPTQGHPGHGATMDGVPLVTLEVPVWEIEAVREELMLILMRNAECPTEPPTHAHLRSFLARLQSPTPAGEATE